MDYSSLNCQNKNEQTQNQNIQIENAFQRQIQFEGQQQYKANSFSHTPTNGEIQNLKRINNNSMSDTPQQKVIRKQFSKSNERQNCNNNSNIQTESTTVNNLSAIQTQNNQNNMSGFLQPISIKNSSINDTSSTLAPSYNSQGYLNNFYTNIQNNLILRPITQTKHSTNSQPIKVLQALDTISFQNTQNIKQNQSLVSQIPIVNCNQNKQININQFSSVPQHINSEYNNFDYTLQPQRQNFMYQENVYKNQDIKINYNLNQAHIGIHNEEHNEFDNNGNKIPTQSDSLSITKEINNEQKQHLRNVDNYKISTKCLNDLNNVSINNKSKPFSLFTKKTEDNDISQNCDLSVVPQETSICNGVSQTFQNNNRQKQSIPSTSSHQLFFNNENNYQCQFKDLLEWNVDISKADLKNSNEYIDNEINSFDINNKPNSKNHSCEKNKTSYCDCMKELAEIKIMISEMQKNQIIQSQINKKLQEDNEYLRKLISSQINQSPKQRKNKNTECGVAKDDNNIQNKENIKSIEKQKYGKLVKSLVSKNKELKQQNVEIETVLKDLLLQNEISRQKFIEKEKTSTKHSRTQSVVSSNNQTEYTLNNNLYNIKQDINTSQSQHIYRNKSHRNSQQNTGSNSKQKGNENKPSTPCQNLNVTLKPNNQKLFETHVLDSLKFNQTKTNLNTTLDNYNNKLELQSENYTYLNKFADEKQNTNDAKIRQILSKIHENNSLSDS